jgi:hypothetical protein
MIKEITRNISGTYIHSNTTVLFNSNPFLLANNDVTLFFTSNDVRIDALVVSTSGNTAVVNFNNPQYNGSPVTVKTAWFGSGITGPQEAFSLNTSTTPSTILQGIGVGGGTNSIAVEVSTELNSGWINIGSLAIAAASNNTAYLAITQPWPFARLNIGSIASSNSVKVNRAS